MTKLLDSEMVDKEQDFERLKQLRQQKISELDNPLLKAIAQKESTGGKNIRHREMKRGLHEGDTAGGAFGIMPKTAIDEIRLNPEFLQKYPEFEKSLQDNKLITEDINNNPEMDIELAKMILARRAGRLAPEAKNLDAETAYSWHHGLQGALNQRNKKDLTQEEYTKDVLRQLMDGRKTLPASE